MDTSGSYIQLNSISKSFGSFTALSQMDVAIGKNEFISLLGPSGSGKTTLLRIIAGLETPTTGRVLIDGQDVTELPPHRRGISMVFQQFLLFPHRTVRENLAFPLRMLNMGKAEIQDRVEWCVKLLSLEGMEDRFPNQLSGGQQQRVALGRGLVGKPRALLLDEPLANLDRELRQEMEVEIRRYQIESGIPFIYVTHNQEEALSMSDRIAVIKGGRLDDFATREQIYDHPKTAFIAQFVGRANKFVGKGAGANTIRCDDVTIQLGASNAVGPSSNAVAFVKYEKVRLSRNDTIAPANAIPVRIESSIFRGNVTEYVLRSSQGRELYASVPRHEASFTHGDTAVASWSPEDIDSFVEKV